MPDYTPQEALERRFRLARRYRRAKRRAARLLDRPVGHFADVSMHQETVRVKEYAREYELIAVKVTEGRTYTDPDAPKRIERTIEVFDAEGLIVLPYHFARPDNGNPPEAEARHAVSTCRELGLRLGERRRRPWKRSELPLALDFEVSAPDAHAWVGSFVAEYRRLTGQRPIIYGYGDSLRPIGTDYGCPVWIAAYAVSWKPHAPHWADEVIAWQHTDGTSGPGPHRLAGIPTNHDVNEFFGSTRELLRLAT